ncbi:kininogen-1 [Neosynchiropus ocellatus]
MTREVRLVLLVLAILQDPRGSAQETTASPPGVPVFCDDHTVQKAAVSAVNAFNQRLSYGLQVALFQVLSASKDGSVYTLAFSGKRSECPVGGSRDWTECDFFTTGRKEPFLCNGTVTVTDTETETTHVACALGESSWSFSQLESATCLHCLTNIPCGFFEEDPVVSERAACLGCPEDIDEKSEDLKVPLSVSIVKFNVESSLSHLFSLHKMGLATRQVFAGFRYSLMFDMRRTTCSKSDHKELSEMCVHDDDNKEFVNCNSTVDLAPWRLEPAEVQINCESGPLPPTSRIKRRPPGWSPLRSAGLASTLAPPTSAAVHQESSEEDTAGTRAPHQQPADAKVDQHHCPSSPWKPLPPSHPMEAVPPSVPHGSSAPPVDGTFSDSDLLG